MTKTSETFTSRARVHFDDLDAGKLRELLDVAAVVNIYNSTGPLLDEVEKGSVYIHGSRSKIFLVPPEIGKRLLEGTKVTVTDHTSKNFSTASVGFHRASEEMKSGRQAIAITKNGTIYAYMIARDLAYQLVKKREIQEESFEHLKIVLDQARAAGKEIRVIVHPDKRIEYIINPKSGPEPREPS